MYRKKMMVRNLETIITPIISNVTLNFLWKANFLPNPILSLELLPISIIVILNSFLFSVGFPNLPAFFLRDFKDQRILIIVLHYCCVIDFIFCTSSSFSVRILTFIQLFTLRWFDYSEYCRGDIYYSFLSH